MFLQKTFDIAWSSRAVNYMKNNSPLKGLFTNKTKRKVGLKVAMACNNKGYFLVLKTILGIRIHQLHGIIIEGNYLGFISLCCNVSWQYKFEY